MTFCFVDFPKTIKRQLSNDILMFRTASSVLHLLPVAGLYTFLPKYLESQFRLPAHDANMITGMGGILVMGVGIVISGVVILKFSPTARSVAAYIAFTALVYSAGMFGIDDFLWIRVLMKCLLYRNGDFNVYRMLDGRFCGIAKI